MADFRRVRSFGSVVRSVPFLMLLLALALPATAAEGEGDGTIFTLWPLVDYRSSTEDDYVNLGVGGPLIKYEKHEEGGRRYGVRPFYFHEEHGEATENDILYPLATYDRIGHASTFQLFHLITSESSAEESGVGDEFMLFPFIFSGQPTAEEGYFALFPLGGKILGRFGRDRINFTLFPLYSRTSKGTTTNTNILWPIVSWKSGSGDESGWALWPLYGTSEKPGVYQRGFFLWPFFFGADERLDTPNPQRSRAFFPLFVYKDSPKRSDHIWLWPFFSHIEDSQRDYEEWNFPWPLLRVAKGDDADKLRLLPFYADERAGVNRNRWYLWPLYKIEQSETSMLTRRRDRVLYFLYSDLSEQLVDEEEPMLRRVALWPLFTYSRIDGVSQFSTLSLLEPFFPENERVERSWSPLWRIYQRRWDGRGDEVSSLLWNLYWKERRGDDLALEIFPLFFYRREDHGESLEISILKGLYRYARQDGEACRYILYLPWGICRKVEHPDVLPPDQER